MSACAGEADPSAHVEALTLEELMDPQSCRGCHTSHYDEWSGSMHAYASVDPVFLAMNARGQRETGGELGDFCVQCHAPLALELGLTTDGLNLDEVPAYAQGITCYYCHSIDGVEGAHNNPLVLSNDGVMRGGYKDPVPNSAHASVYSPYLDRKRRESADLCGSCHDIVTQRGVHLERTYVEWQSSLFNHANDEKLQTCGTCHMPGRDDVAAYGSIVPQREVHHHGMPGVDVALTPFPQREAQRTGVQHALDRSLLAELCVSVEDETTRITVNLENIGAGHGWPSGSAPDRRAWVELAAYSEADEILYSSGRVEEGQAVVDLDDPALWQLRDFTYTDEGEEAHFFWEVANYVSATLAAPTATSILDPNYTDVHQSRVYTYEGPPPARVAMQVNMRPIGRDILRELVDSGDLAAEVMDSMPTFTLRTTALTWRAEDDVPCVPVGLSP